MCTRNYIACLSLRVHHRNVGAQGTVHPKALVAEEHAKGGRGEAWIALAAVAACLVRLLLQQSSQVLHSDSATKMERRNYEWKKDHNFF